MSHCLKFLCVTALSSMVLMACSNEVAHEPIADVKEQASNALDTAKAEAKKVAMIAEEKARVLKEKNLEAQAKAELEAKAAKEAMLKVEAEALAAKKAGEAKAAAQAAEQRRIAELEQTATLEKKRIEAQRIEAQRVEVQRLEAERLEAQRVEALRIQEAQAAQAIIVPPPVTVQQSVPTKEIENRPVVTTQAPIVQAGPNASYNAFLSKYVSTVNGINLVAYDRVTAADRAMLRSYIETLSAIDIEALPRDAEMATWFNLYNAKTIELILENYPTKSIRKISNPWKKDRLVVNGKNMSLDDIEHGTVRKKYDEPRVHYAFNCASIGCPNVKRSAWEASTLEADLSQAARDFIASERGVSVQGSKITASSIFKWYKKDFGGNESGILAHLRQYATGSKKAALDAANDISRYQYDWDLNVR